MRIGTRGSALALAQSGLVQKLLGGESRCSLTVIETTGDRNPLASLRRIGGKGIFTKEIDTALLEGRIDLAVHSLKDLPTEEIPGLAIGALLKREDISLGDDRIRRLFLTSMKKKEVNLLRSCGECLHWPSTINEHRR